MQNIKFWLSLLWLHVDMINIVFRNSAFIVIYCEILFQNVIIFYFKIFLILNWTNFVIVIKC